MTSIHRLVQLTLEHAAKRLDQAIAEAIPEFSRSRLQSWMKSGELTVDGNIVRPRDLAKGDERIQLQCTLRETLKDHAQAMTLDVLLEDPEFFVLNKPAGLVVHPGAGNPDQTLLNGLLHLDPGLASVPRAGLVHRLDKDTTGCLVVARTLSAHTALVEQLAEREIGREYLALVNGVPVAGGLIDVPIGRDPHDRMKYHADSHGRPSKTHFRVRERFRAHALIALKLETGRTHQIRVHMQYSGLPIIGDQLYGGRFKRPKGITAPALEALMAFKRQALHAFRLAFEHPKSRKAVSVDAPPPEDFARLLTALRADAAAIQQDW